MYLLGGAAESVFQLKSAARSGQQHGPFVARIYNLQSLASAGTPSAAVAGGARAATPPARRARACAPLPQQGLTDGVHHWTATRGAWGRWGSRELRARVADEHLLVPPARAGGAGGAGRRQEAVAGRAHGS